jgi:hypothetical protein
MGAHSGYSRGTHGLRWSAGTLRVPSRLASPTLCRVEPWTTCRRRTLGTGLTPAHICSGPGSPLPTSAPGPGSPMPQLRRDRARPSDHRKGGGAGGRSRARAARHLSHVVAGEARQQRNHEDIVLQSQRHSRGTQAALKGYSRGTQGVRTHRRHYKVDRERVEHDVERREVRCDKEHRRRSCGRGERSPGADVAGASAVPLQMWAGVSPVPLQCVEFTHRWRHDSTAAQRCDAKAIAQIWRALREHSTGIEVYSRGTQGVLKGYSRGTQGGLKAYRSGGRAGWSCGRTTAATPWRG